MNTPTELFLLVLLFASVGVNGILWPRASHPRQERGQ